MPSEGVELLKHKDILSYDEIIAVTKKAVELSVNKIRITGGEPLVRKGILYLIEKLAKIAGIQDFGMTSNGILLHKYAWDLKKSGLHRINISLDTLNPEKYKKITRGGDISLVFKGIKAAKKAGLLPVKINCVIKKSLQEPDALEVKDFCERNALQVRFIRQMDLSTGEFWQVYGGEGGNCSKCNRLRLTANGFVKPCLFSNIGFSVRELGVETAIREAIDKKPRCGTANFINHFNNIGG